MKGADVAAGAARTREGGLAGVGMVPGTGSVA